MMRTSFVMAHAACVLLVALGLGTGCQTTKCNNGEGGAGGGLGEGSGGAGARTSPPSDHPAAVRIGFGAYNGPCDGEGTFVEKADAPGQLGSIASQKITFTFPGTIVAASVVHVISGVNGACDAVGRDVLLSEPTKDAVPNSPGLHERFTWSSEELAAAPNYAMPDAAYGSLKELGRKLEKPLHVKNYDTVFLGSVLETGSECLVGCGGPLVDGSMPPEGDSFCTVGESWTGCGVMPPTPDAFYLAYLGWVDVVPDEP